ncbi:MAG TPA: hypothetical protein VGE70_01085 [Burkholderiaceae bacterium]
MGASLFFRGRHARRKACGLLLVLSIGGMGIAAPSLAAEQLVDVAPVRAWLALQQQAHADALPVLAEDAARFEATLRLPDAGVVHIGVDWDERGGGSRLQWQGEAGADPRTFANWIARVAQRAVATPPENPLCQGQQATPEALAEAGAGQQAPTCRYGAGQFSSALFELEKCGDFESSLKILAACVAEKHAGGLIRLASFYDNGYGVPRRPERMAEFLRQAGESDTPGYAEMGRLHYATALYFGVGVPGDRVRARALFESLAAAGNADARSFLATGQHSAWLRPDGTPYVDPLWQAPAAEDMPTPALSRDLSGNEFSYGAHIRSTSRFKCLYGYVADKTGDHAAAIAIFEDCIARWNDVYSMLWLAQILESGVGAPRDLVRATDLMRRGAESDDATGYGALARYHYGVALREGRGVAHDMVAARHWLERAAREGVPEATQYLAMHFGDTPSTAVRLPATAHDMR